MGVSPRDQGPGSRPRLEPGFAARSRLMPAASAALNAEDRKSGCASMGHLERKYPVRILSEAWKNLSEALTSLVLVNLVSSVWQQSPGAHYWQTALGKVPPDITALARRTKAEGAERKPALAALSSSREDVTLIISNTALSQSMESHWACFPAFLYCKKCPTHTGKQNCIINPRHPSLLRGPQLSPTDPLPLVSFGGFYVEWTHTEMHQLALCDSGRWIC